MPTPRPGISTALARGEVLLFLGLVLALLLTPAVVSAQSQLRRSAQTKVPIPFDIPSQPLASALKTYGEIAAIDLFYDSTVVAGVRSAPVRGTLEPSAALRLMLEGTGLTATSLAPGTVTIIPDARASNHPDLAETDAKLAPFLPYLGQVQEGIRYALCREPAVRTDPAELLVRLWIAPSGAVSAVALFSQAGTPFSRPAYVAALTRLTLEPPPPDMPQPVTVMLLPRTSLQAAGCDHE